MTEAFSTEKGRKAFVDMARRVLKENPDLVFDVLKDHEDLVFTHAQNGAMVKKRRALASRWVEDAKHPKILNVLSGPAAAVREPPDAIHAQQAEDVFHAESHLHVGMTDCLLYTSRCV